MTETKRGRWRCRYSLASLMILVTCVSVGLCLVRRRLNRAQAQHSAVVAIAERGGRAFYDYELRPDLAPGGKRVPSAPAWALKLFGVDFFCNIKAVNVGLDAADEDLKSVGHLLQADWVKLSGAHGLTDAGLVHLGKMGGLRTLELAETAVTDEGLRLVGSFRGLEELDLDDTKVSDGGLVHLRHLDRLSALTLRGTRINGAGLTRLSVLRRLTGLAVERSGVTDAGLDGVSSLTGLQWLSLGATKVTDAGMTKLRGLRRLQRLYLFGNRVSDVGLSELHALSDLKELSLTGTNVSIQGVRAFERAVPNCIVYADDEEHRPAVIQ